MVKTQESCYWSHAAVMFSVKELWCDWRTSSNRSWYWRLSDMLWTLMLSGCFCVVSGVLLFVCVKCVVFSWECLEFNESKCLNIFTPGCQHLWDLRLVYFSLECVCVCVCCVVLCFGLLGFIWLVFQSVKHTLCVLSPVVMFVCKHSREFTAGFTYRTLLIETYRKCITNSILFRAVKKNLSFLLCCGTVHRWTQRSCEVFLSQVNHHLETVETWRDFIWDTSLQEENCIAQGLLFQMSSWRCDRQLYSRCFSEKWMNTDICSSVWVICVYDVILRWSWCVEQLMFSCSEAEPSTCSWCSRKLCY